MLSRPIASRLVATGVALAVVIGMAHGTGHRLRAQVPPPPPQEPLAKADIDAFAAAWAKQPRTDLGIPLEGAKVLVVKFNDYQCPTCGVLHAWYKPVFDQLEKSNPGAVRLLLKDWPWNSKCNFNLAPGSLPNHPGACEGAAAARMARDISKAKELEMQEWLYGNQPTLTAITVRAAAERILGIRNFDAEYAKKTLYGSIVAPPSFIWATMAHVQFGWKGLGGFHSGCNIEFYKPIYLNDKVTSECIFTGFDGPKPSEFAEEMVIDHFDNKYWNQHGDLLVKYHWWIIRIGRGKAKEKGKYSKLTLPHPWTEEELKKIEEEVLSEEFRGSNPRYWEDVNVGDELKPVVKGPLGLTDELAYFVGGATPIPRLSAHGASLRQYRRHPAWSFRDPTTGALEPIFAVHYNKEAARAMGVPMQYDVGLQRHCWGIHLLTNWMGDEG
jgi:hypothetical protein